MRPDRRQILRAGGAFLAALPASRLPARSDEAVEIIMHGNTDGSRVWFDPIGLQLGPGQTVRWINRDEGNAHTSTAYHPDIGDHMRRMPAAARPWDSGYLLPGKAFSVTLAVPGVYDYYCLPHEHAGMVGRIVVGDTLDADWEDAPPDRPGLEPVPEVALEAFPTVQEILRTGLVRPPLRQGG